MIIFEVKYVKEKDKLMVCFEKENDEIINYNYKKTVFASKDKNSQYSLCNFYLNNNRRAGTKFLINKNCISTFKNVDIETENINKENNKELLKTMLR